MRPGAKSLAPDCVSVVNRALYGSLGNEGYRWALRQQAERDAREFLRRLYRPSFAKRLLTPRARWRYRSLRRTALRADRETRRI